MKPRVLFISEASYLSTGYATYGREVLKRLDATKKYEIAEMSIYGHHKDDRRKTIPWTNYPNHPSPDQTEAIAEYNKQPLSQFGAARFERICIDFKPTHVLSIRDHWMDSFISGSVYRPRFKWIWMPTVDAAPQSSEWIDTFSNCDVLLTYSEWAIDLLKSQGGNSLNVVGAAPASAQSEFHPKDQKECRERLGIDPSIKIIGTVMRNQRRKLYDDTLNIFRRYLDESKRDDVYLYIHTGFPDNGWPLNNMIVEYGIGSRVLMTYLCENCNHMFASFFSGALRQCPKCAVFTAKTAGVAKGATLDQLSDMYNCFDIYAQIANSEGFGIPQIEAAFCGVPVMATDYSAMADVVRNVNGYPIKVKTTYREMETGCYRAVPDHDSAVAIIKRLLDRDHDPSINKKLATEGANKNYSWDTTAKVWEDCIDSLPMLSNDKGWDAPPILANPIPFEKLPEFNNNKLFIDFMSTEFLKQKRHLGSYSNLALLRDFNYGFFKPQPGGFFYSDSSVFGRNLAEGLSKETIHKMFSAKLEQNNFWEKIRAGMVSLAREEWM
jgi:glycosyltransferase involved in cell wall biosynthesis